MLMHDDEDKKMKMAVLGHLMKKMAQEDFAKKFPGGKRPDMVIMKGSVSDSPRKLTDMTPAGEEHEMADVDTGSHRDAEDMDDMENHEPGEGLHDEYEEDKMKGKSLHGINEEEHMLHEQESGEERGLEHDYSETEHDKDEDDDSSSM